MFAWLGGYPLHVCIYVSHPTTGSGFILYFSETETNSVAMRDHETRVSDRPRLDHRLSDLLGLLLSAVIFLRVSRSSTS